MKKLLYFLTLFIGFSLSAQVTIVVDELPEGTSQNATVFISGDFEGWSGGKKAYQLSKEQGKYTITLPKRLKRILFKFTQGSWKSVECATNGTSVDNRAYVFKQAKDTLYVKIKGWSHLIPKKQKSTAAKNVTVLAKDFEIPQLNRKRRVWIYLPPGYHNATASYPVVYMHDGQNLFDTETSYSGEWGIDETLNKLFDEKGMQLIVVGVDNGGAKRLDEYSPWVNQKYGGGEGEAYLQFLVKTLKPYVDKNYRTLTGRNNTGIIGSSMGGLISHYAGLKYPNVFGKIGVYSPAFWFAPKVYDFSKTHGKLKETKVYFLAGGKEGSNVGYQEINETVQGMHKMISLLKHQKFPNKNIRSKVVPEGKHNEELWKTNFEETIQWLFPEAIKERTFTAAKRTGNTLEVKVSDGIYYIKFYTPKIVETTFVPKGEQFIKKSHAVVLSPKSLSISLDDIGKMLKFSSKGIQVEIQKQPFQIRYFYKGKEVTSEKNGYRKIDAGERLQFNLTSEEVLYGGGSRALGMNRRGHKLQLYNKAHYGYETKAPLMNYTMPLVLSSKQYAIHFDNAPIGYLDLDSQKNNTLTYETISGRKTYQVIVGDSWLDLVDNYTELTGKQPMLPRWALGNFASRFGYHSQKETETTIEKFQSEKIPVDAVILDLFWFGKDVKGTMGNLEVYKDSFPNMPKMIRDFKKKGVKTILITEPFVLTTSKRWKEAVNKDVLAKDSLGKPFRFDFYFGNTGLIDIYKPEAKEWFWEIYKDLKNMGVAGFWGDLGEPEVHPSQLLHATGTADEVHNIYGHDWARLIFEGYQKEYPNERPFILMRAGYSGSQRFGMIPWSGDVNRTWGGLQSQPEIALQMGMQGLAFMHSDLGGFAGNNLNDELYVRWLQYGVFQPIYRPHAQEEVPSEPVFRSEWAKKLAKQAITLRYQMLPYNYHLAFENHTKGKPLMRPLFFEDNSKMLQDVATTYFWGNDFLVTPIVKEKITKQNVHFPKNTIWFDFYTDRRVTGGKATAVPISESNIPTYVRAGAFITLAKPMQHTEMYTGKSFALHYYHDTTISQSNRKLYQDDGKTVKAYEKGMYELLQFTSAYQKNDLEIVLKSITGRAYTSSKKEIDLIIHNIPTIPKKIKVGKKKVKINWNSTKKIIRIPVRWNTKKTKKITVKF